jgi:hypothetical protein
VDVARSSAIDVIEEGLDKFISEHHEKRVEEEDGQPANGVVYPRMIAG